MAVNELGKKPASCYCGELGINTIKMGVYPDNHISSFSYKKEIEVQLINRGKEKQKKNGFWGIKRSAGSAAEKIWRMRWGLEGG